MKKTKLRLTLEVISAMLLSFGIWYERGVLVDSWHILRNSTVAYAIPCFLLVWLNFLWSGVGYKLLAPKIKLSQVSMAHLAASGPGRVIPGGAGHMSFGVLFLKKQGYKLEQSVAVALTNNIAGFLVNSLLLLSIIIIKPALVTDITVSVHRLIWLCVFVLSLLTGLVVYSRYKGKRNIIARSQKALAALSKSRLKKPSIALGLVMTMLATITTNTAILFLASKATGLDTSVWQSFFVTSMGVAAGSLLPTPGGIGGVEAGLIATLSVLGYDITTATATALLFRSATYLQPFIPGIVAYLYLRGRKLL